MDSSPAEKDAAHEAFDETLSHLDKANREPDRWEESCFARAITAMACGMYRLATVELQVCKIAPGNRLLESYRHDWPLKFTKKNLRDALASLKSLQTKE